MARFYRHDSAATYFTPAELHLGEISLECSRAGAGAVALWATQRLLPPEPDGEFAQSLDSCRAAALSLYAALGDDERCHLLMPPDLDIVVWAPAGATATEISALAKRRFDRCAERGLHLALLQFPSALAARWWHEVEFDHPTVTLLRSCLIKPEHERWLPAILQILRETARAALRPAGRISSRRLPGRSS